MTDDRPGRFHADGPDTEVEAAQSVRTITGKLRQTALLFLRLSGEWGLTDDEGGQLMGGDRLRFGRRRQELAMSGLVVDSGVRRPTPSGRSAVVWVLAEYLDGE